LKDGVKLHHVPQLVREQIKEIAVIVLRSDRLGESNERLVSGSKRAAVAGASGTSVFGAVSMVDRSARPPKGGHYVFAGPSLTSTLTH
jgi:hypothetical protein